MASPGKTFNELQAVDRRKCFAAGSCVRAACASGQQLVDRQRAIWIAVKHAPTNAERLGTQSRDDADAARRAKPVSTERNAAQMKPKMPPRNLAEAKAELAAAEQAVITAEAASIAREVALGSSPEFIVLLQKMFRDSKGREYH